MGVNDWGYSIFDFDLNADSPGSNRFGDAWQDKEQKQVGVEELIGGDLICLLIDYNWRRLNIECDINIDGTIFQLLNIFNNTNNNVYDKWNIESKYLEQSERNNRHSNTFAVQMNQTIYGWVCLQWSDDPPTVENGLSFKVCEVIGGGTLAKPLNMDFINASPISTANPICGLPYSVLCTSKKSLGFDRDAEHRVGYTAIPLRSFWGADWKGLFCAQGHKGSSARHRCPWCDSAKVDQVKSPTPANRKWHSKTKIVNQQSAISSLTQTHEHLDLSFKRYPLLPTGFENICLPTLHTNLGPIHKVFVAIRDKVQSSLINDNRQILQYNTMYSEKHKLQSEIQNLKMSLSFFKDTIMDDNVDPQFKQTVETQQNTIKSQIVNKKKLLKKKKNK